MNRMKKKNKDLVMRKGPLESEDWRGPLFHKAKRTIQKIPTFTNLISLITVPHAYNITRINTKSNLICMHEQYEVIKISKKNYKKKRKYLVTDLQNLVKEIWKFDLRSTIDKSEDFWNEH